MRAVKRNILLNPGPATTTDTVKYAQVVPDICPREAEFGILLDYVTSELVQFVADPAQFAAVLFGGSGTAAVESVLSSVIGEDAVLILNNGAYGKRMCEIAAAYGLNYLEFKSPFDQPVDLAEFESAMRRAGCGISHVAVVHHETTTGILNDIGAIGKVCNQYDADLIVDAVSSYGAIPIQMKEMNVTYLAASSNKNLQGMPGVSFVIAKKSRLVNRSAPKRRNCYLNLYDQYRHFAETRQMRFTPPVQTLYALKQAIKELKQEGVKERYARYAKSWETLTRGLDQLGLKHLIDAKHHSKLVTSVFEPVCPGYRFQDLHDYFYTKGYTIYPGKLETFNTFRIANIGDITFRDIKAFLELLERYLRNIGYRTTPLNPPTHPECYE